jgi:hypothetical protein
MILIKAKSKIYLDLFQIIIKKLAANSLNRFVPQKHGVLIYYILRDGILMSRKNLI